MIKFCHWFNCFKQFWNVINSFNYLQKAFKIQPDRNKFWLAEILNKYPLSIIFESYPFYLENCFLKNYERLSSLKQSQFFSFFFLIAILNFKETVF